MYNGISYYDWQTILTLLEAVAWAAVVGVAVVVLLQTKSKWLTAQRKQIVLLVFAAWAVASLGLASLTTYNYFHNDRASIIQSIASQKKQYGQ